MIIKNETGLVRDTIITNDDGSPIHGVCAVDLHLEGNGNLVEAKATLENVKVIIEKGVGKVTYQIKHPVYGHMADIERIVFRGPDNDIISDI